MIDINELLGGIVIEINNGKDGMQPFLVIQEINGNRYIITATPIGTFKVGWEEN